MLLLHSLLLLRTPWLLRLLLVLPPLTRRCSEKLLLRSASIGVMAHAATPVTLHS